MVGCMYKRTREWERKKERKVFRKTWFPSSFLLYIFIVFFFTYIGIEYNFLSLHWHANVSDNSGMCGNCIYTWMNVLKKEGKIIIIMTTMMMTTTATLDQKNILYYIWIYIFFTSFCPVFFFYSSLTHFFFLHHIYVSCQGTRNFVTSTLEKSTNQSIIQWYDNFKVFW